MSTYFTDLLDEYLDASRELNEAKAAHSGYDFSYFHFDIVDREEKARAALNEAFAKATGSQA